MLENKEATEIMETIANFVADDEELKRINEKIEIGVFSFEREELKTLIMNMAVDCLELIEETLPEIIMRRSKVFISQMQDLHARLTKSVLDVEGFIEYMKTYEDCRTEFEDLAMEFKTLQDMQMVFSNETYRMKCPDECKNSFILIKNNKELVKKVTDEIGEKMDQETARYKKELTSLIPHLEKDRKEVEEIMESLDVDNPDRDPAQLSS